ncbi:MAG: cytosine permease, partial [Oscillospiraceae bacterium]
RVPQGEKKSLFDVTMVAAGFCICMSGLFTGASMAGGLNLGQAITAAIFGNLILSLYGGFLGQAGAREGVATPMLSRHSFGREGSKVVSLVLSVTMAGWYAVQVGLFGDTIYAMFPQGGFITLPSVAAVWGGLLMLLSAYFGYKGLSLLSKIAVPLIIITAIIGINASIAHTGSWEVLSQMQPPVNIGVGAGIVLAVGSFAGGASAQADITRYAKSPRAAWIATILGYMIANVFIIIAGFITNMATGAGDLPASMLALGLGFPALVVLIGAQWTTNDNNLYTASLGFANVIPVKKSKITLCVGIGATLIGAMGLSDYFTSWLVLLGIGLPPMAAIIIADYYFIHNMHYSYEK